jgi:hypothetical protein
MPYMSRHRHQLILGDGLAVEVARRWDDMVDRLLAEGFTLGRAQLLADRQAHYPFDPVLQDEHQADRDNAVEDQDWTLRRWEQRSKERGERSSSKSEEVLPACEVTLVPEHEHFLYEVAPSARNADASG